MQQIPVNRPLANPLLGTSIALAFALSSCGSSSTGGPTPPALSNPTVTYVTDSTTLNEREIWLRQGQGLRNLSAFLPSTVSPTRVLTNPGADMLVVPYRNAGSNYVAFLDLQGNLVEEADLGVHTLGGGEQITFGRINISPQGDRAVVELGSSAFSAPKIMFVSSSGIQEEMNTTRQVRSFEWASDGGFILVHYGFSSSNEFLSLYDRNGDNSFVISPISGADQTFHDVSWSPNGQQVAYRAETLPGSGGMPFRSLVFDLGLGINMELGDNVASQRSFDFSNDSQWYSYLANTTQPGLAELFVANQLNPGSPLQVSQGISTLMGEIEEVEWAPIGTELAYVAAHRLSDALELFVADTQGAWRPMHTLMAGTTVTKVYWSPDSQNIAYLADHATPGVQDLYVVAADGMSAPIKLSLVQAGEVIRDVEWAQNSNWLVFEYENSAADRHRLAGYQGSPWIREVHLGDSDASPGRFFDWSVALDSLGVVWLREVPFTGVQEVVLTNFFDSTQPVVLSGPFAPGVEGATFNLEVR